MTDSQIIFNSQITCPYVICKHKGAVGEFKIGLNINLDIGQAALIECRCPECKKIFNIKIKAVKRFEIITGTIK